MAASVGVTDMVSAPIDAVALEAVEDFQQRDVGFGDGLVEPILFEEVVVLGMADERQVGVQDQTEITERHGTPTACEKETQSPLPNELRLFRYGGAGRIQAASPIAADRSAGQPLPNLAFTRKVPGNDRCR